MDRPVDISGNLVEMGPWYWARNRRKQIVGVGKFAVTIGSDEITWFINGTGYDPWMFVFEKAVSSRLEQDTEAPAQAGTHHGE